MSDNKPQKVLEIVDSENQITRFYVQLNDESTKFMLMVVSSCKMSNADILDAVAMFAEHKDSENLFGGELAGNTH